jgi:hypothetical protein|nr:MAG TPA: hypothetical protein [Caudoviricetes sp.]
MKRLTERVNDGLIMTKQDSGDNVSYYWDWDEENFKVAEKLATYEDLEEQGLLVRLPCKVGDIMFRINKGAKNPVIELTVTQIDITTRSYNLEVIDRDCGELMCFKNDIGKTIFLTREDAEKKLEEIQNDKT